ncbi:hypothetical protein NEMBOFW57_008533 [Staphylotrichum longicolle]|uniref:Uncharacterized protein n=1 Tax=Staphylotrichum longicolle TaxID=669026 RepID=A0AAD4ERG1_9PEZI|nr:hypothetical protein NEMBOFW57_008533 [Staphylotrichum longicolle]
MKDTSTSKAVDSFKDVESSRDSFIRFIRNSLALSAKERPTLESRRSSNSSDAETLVSCTSATTTYSASSVSTTPEQPTAAEQRLIAVWKAEEFLRAFINEDWSNHANYIRADCNLTLAELYAIGRLPEAEGSRTCRRLIRVPVIHEEVALSLWKKLAEKARNIPEPAQEPEVAKNDRKGSVDSRMRKNLRRLLKKEQHSHRQTEEALAASLRCPYCSGNCADYHAQTMTKESQKHQPPSEEGFWQREDPTSSRKPSWVTTTTTLIDTSSEPPTTEKGDKWDRWLEGLRKGWVVGGWTSEWKWDKWFR